MTEHTHVRSTELWIFEIPANPSKPMGLKVTTHQLSSMQGAVGGYIEIVRTQLMPTLRCGCSVIMVANEEGAIRNHPLNRRASSLYPRPDSIFGDVFLVGEGPVEAEGFPEDDMISLDPEYCRWQGPGHSIPKPNKVERLAIKSKMR